MLRKFAVVAVLSFAMVAGWATAAKPDPNPTVTIMTQNMDDGTDQAYIIGSLLGLIPIDVPTAVDLTLAELQASNFEGRADLMAAKIAEEKPQLVALQEAALWRTGSSLTTATTVVADQLGLLLKALTAAGVPYDVVAVNHLSDLALPGTEIGALRFTDRNAVLVRSDLRPPQFHLSNVHARSFATAFPFTVSEDLTLTIPAGWISVDVHMGNKQFRFVTTHLESPIAGIPEATAVQAAQAQQLIHELRNLTIPVVICGDFNSDANRGEGVEDTGTFHLFELAGYGDAWPVANPSDPGFTWPIYLEDLFPAPPFFMLPDPKKLERIDLFFSKGMVVDGAKLVVLSPVGPWPLAAPPFASDHAGLIAVFHP